MTFVLFQLVSLCVCVIMAKCAPGEETPPVAGITTEEHFEKCCHSPKVKFKASNGARSRDVGSGERGQWIPHLT